MANKMGCWKWAIVGSSGVALVLTIAIIVGFSLQKRTRNDAETHPGRSIQLCYLVVFPIPHSLPPEGPVPTDSAVGLCSPPHCCCCSVTKSPLTLCNPMDRSTPGFWPLLSSGAW